MLELEIAYSLDRDGLTVTTTATNVGSGDCPFGAGFHPYLTLGTPTVDSLTLNAPGRSYLEADERGIPVRALPVAGSELDFSAPREIGSAGPRYRLHRPRARLRRAGASAADGAGEW